MLSTWIIAAALGSVTWQNPPDIQTEGAGYRADVRLALDLSFEDVAAILEDVGRYDRWVPTVERVFDLQTIDEGVSARFTHKIPVLPNFPCRVAYRTTWHDALLVVDLTFLECFFDDQLMRMILAPDGRGSKLQVTWSASLRRWFVPQGIVRGFLKRMVEAAPEALDAYGHELASGEAG